MLRYLRSVTFGIIISFMRILRAPRIPDLPERPVALDYTDLEASVLPDPVAIKAAWEATLDEPNRREACRRILSLRLNSGTPPSSSIGSAEKFTLFDGLATPDGILLQVARAALKDEVGALIVG